MTKKQLYEAICTKCKQIKPKCLPVSENEGGALYSCIQCAYDTIESLRVSGNDKGVKSWKDWLGEYRIDD